MKIYFKNYKLTIYFSSNKRDVVKTRLQIQGQLINSCNSSYLAKSKYNGMINCFNVMIKEEGLLSLYRGYLRIHFGLELFNWKIYIYNKVKASTFTTSLLRDA